MQDKKILVILILRKLEIDMIIEEESNPAEKEAVAELEKNRDVKVKNHQIIEVEETDFIEGEYVKDIMKEEAIEGIMMEEEDMIRGNKIEQEMIIARQLAEKTPLKIHKMYRPYN